MVLEIFDVLDEQNQYFISLKAIAANPCTYGFVNLFWFRNAGMKNLVFARAAHVITVLCVFFLQFDSCYSYLRQSFAFFYSKTFLLPSVSLDQPVQKSVSRAFQVTLKSLIDIPEAKRAQK